MLSERLRSEQQSKQPMCTMTGLDAKLHGTELRDGIPLAALRLINF